MLETFNENNKNTPKRNKQQVTVIKDAIVIMPFLANELAALFK